eukprot:6909575-Pyramimonas_sp.AAC.1
MAPKVVAADPRAGGVIIKPYRRQKKNSDEIPPDVIGIVALICALFGTLSKVRVYMAKLDSCDNRCSNLRLQRPGWSSICRTLSTSSKV